MANLKSSKSQSMGLHKEVLKGRTQQVFFNPEEAENFFYYGAYDVDFNKRTEIDAKDLSCKELNSKINSFMKEGYGTVVVKNPQGKHSLGVGILNKLNLIFEGSLGYLQGLPFTDLLPDDTPLLEMIDKVILNYDNESVLREVKKDVNQMMSDRPLFNP